MTVTSPIPVRAMRAGDRPFILATWLRGLRASNREYGRIPKRVYFPTYHAVFDGLMQRDHVLVVTSHADPNYIHGWLCYSTSLAPLACVHWMHVKGGQRRMGLGRLLLRTAGITESSSVVRTFTNKAGDKLAARAARSEHVPIEELMS